MALAAGRSEANFEELARALDISEDEARRLTAEILDAQAAATRLENAARDVARQLDLSEDEANRLTRSLREADRAAEGIDTRTGALAAGFTGIRGVVAGIGSALAVIGGAQILGVAVRGVQAALTQFQALNESINAVQVTFEDASGIITDFGEVSAQAAGLSAQAFQQAVVPIGSVLRNFGFDAQGAADASIELVQRAADLASVFNTDVSEALLAINSALVGQVEPLRRYGAEVSVARTEQFALAQGIIASKDEFNEQARVAARVGLILADTARVQGDFVNTSDQLANAQRIARAETEEFAARVGEQLAPAMAALVAILPEVLEGVQQLVPAFAAGADSAAAFFKSIEDGGPGFRTFGAGLRAVVGTALDIHGVLRDVLAVAFDVATANAVGVGEALFTIKDRLERSGLRSFGVALARDLDSGTEGTEAFTRAFVGLSRATSGLRTFTQGYRDFAIQANLTQPALQQITIDLLANRQELGLTAPEVEFLTEQLALLNVELTVVSDRVPRAGRAIAEDLATGAANAGSALEEVRQGAEDAGLSLTDLVVATDPAAEALTAILTPAEQTALAFEALRIESGAAATIFGQTVRPALAEVSQALEDLNDDGRVTKDEFIANLRAMAAAQLEFTSAIATIATIDPDLAVRLATLPIEQALETIREIAADPANARQTVEALFGTADQLQDEILGLFNVGVPALFDASPRVVAGFISSIETSIKDPARREQISNALRAVLDPALAVSFADLAIPDIGPQIEEALGQPEAARGGARITIDAYRRDLIDELAAERLGIQGDIQTEIDRVFGALNINVDFGQDGAESADTFVDGFIEEMNTSRTRLRTSIRSTVDAAIQRFSPPKLFLDAGFESGEAFWLGFDQAELSIRAPVASITGSIATTTQATDGTNGFVFSPTYVNTETRDLETVVARSEQTMAAVSGLLGKIKFV